MKKPRKPRGIKPYIPTRPPKMIQSSTRVAEFKFSEYNFDIEKLSDLLESYPHTDYRYDLTGSEYHYDYSLTGSEYDGQHEINGSIHIYPKTPVPNPRYDELKLRYDQELAEYKENIKVWNKYEDAMKEYNQWKAEETERKQYERLRKKYENE